MNMTTFFGVYFYNFYRPLILHSFSSLYRRFHIIYNRAKKLFSIFCRKDNIVSYLKFFVIKIQENRLSKAQKEALFTIFIEQKWYKNYILAWSEKDKNNKITKFDTKQNNITHKDKDMNDIPVIIKYLSASQRQCLVSRMYSNIKTLHTLKVNGKQAPGKLKFSKEETIIDLKQYGVTHKIVSSKRIKIQGIPKSLVVNGLKQFINIPDLEYANARLLRKGTGYYVQFVVYVSKESNQKKK